MIPLFHDFADSTVLIFGGGPVGARKARRFSRATSVLIVSPAFTENDYGTAERIRAMPEPADVEWWITRVDPVLVVAATDDSAVNEAIEEGAQRASILVNRADVGGEREAGSVVVPATIREDPVVVAIGTSGLSPELSRYLRENLQEQVAGAGIIAEVVAELRSELQESMDRSGYQAALRAVVTSDEVWDAAKTGGDVRAVANEIVAEYLGTEIE